MKRLWLALACAAILLFPGLAFTAWADLPHLDYVTQTKTATGTSASATVLWTPASGKRIMLQGCIFGFEGPGRVQLDEGDSGDDVIPSVGVATQGTIVVDANGGLLWVGDVNETLTWTTSQSATQRSIMCWGYEAQ